jgi:imidazoleglycerol phosphate dehydratase HisB
LDSKMDQQIDIATGIGFLDHVWFFRFMFLQLTQHSANLASLLFILDVSRFG